MLDLLEIIAAVGEVLFSWRFFLCLALALGAVAAVYGLVPNRTVCLSISIFVAAVGIIGGFIWQWRNDKP
jgi:hypothetical protein